jgi:hypothetical protein
VDAESNADGMPVNAARSQGCSFPFRGTKYETLSELPWRLTEDFVVGLKPRCGDPARFKAS